MNKTIRRTPSAGSARPAKSNATRWPSTGATVPSRRVVSGGRPGNTTPGFKPGSRRSKV